MFKMFCWVILLGLLCSYVKGNYEECILECESKADIHKYAEQPVEHCNKPEVLEEIKKGLYGCGRGPIETIVKLKAESPDVSYIPPIVKVNRCRGFCGGGLACNPSETAMKQFTVKKREDKHISCGIVEVEEHTSCKCDCSQLNCNDKQKFEDCECKCQNEDELSECENSEKHEWNPTDCACKCKMVEECGTMHMWDSKECKCVLMENNAIEQ